VAAGDRYGRSGQETMGIIEGQWKACGRRWQARREGSECGAGM